MITDLSIVILSMWFNVSDDCLHNYQVQPDTAVVACEVSIANTFSPLSDGVHQRYRNVPLLVKLDTSNKLISYDTVLMPQIVGANIDVSNVCNCCYQPTNDTKDEYIYIYSPVLRRKVNKYYKKYAPKRRFDGYIYYIPLEIIYYKSYVKMREFAVPNTNYHEVEQIIKFASITTIAIDSVISCRVLPMRSRNFNY